MPLTFSRLAFDSPLGRWTFERAAASELASVIESIWEVDGAIAHRLSRIFPSGRIDLLLNLGPPQRVVEGTGIVDFSETCISGFQNAPIVVESSLRTHLFGVRIYAAAAAALLGTSMTAIAGRVEGVGDVCAFPSRSLVDDLRGAGSFSDRARMVCRWAEEQLCVQRRATPYVGWIAEAIERSAGNARIDALRREAGVSEKKLANDFRERVGVTPKLYARVMRFQRSLAVLQRGRSSIAEVAMGCGYFDQAHMDRDFRQLAGVSPREFVALTYPDRTSARIE